MFKRRKSANILKSDDLVLLTMLNFPNGVVGESTIHEFIYQLVQIEPYEPLKNTLNFIEIEGGLHFSQQVHKSIVENCRDVSNVERGSFSSRDSTSAIFSDNLRFDSYEEVNKKEEGMAKYISNYSPKIYFLSAMGRSVAILALREKLNRAQKSVLGEIANAYSAL